MKNFSASWRPSRRDRNDRLLPGREKLCATCLRPFRWRRKWSDRWDQVKYCSMRCRRTRRYSASA